MILKAAAEDPELAEKMDAAMGNSSDTHTHPVTKSLAKISTTNLGKSKSVTIADKLWAINAVEEMKKKGSKWPERDMLSKYGKGTKGLPGTGGKVLAQGQLSRWRTKSKEEHWETLDKATAAKVCEAPSHLKKV